MLKELHPEGVWDGRPMGMSQGVLTEDGLIFVSGQVGWDEAGQVRGEGVEAQAELALENLGRVLAEAGAQASDVIRLRVYVRGELEASMGPAVGALRAFFGDAHRPAVTGIGVASLATPDTLIEIEAVARVG